MSGKVVFSLTASQSAALMAIQAGATVNAATPAARQRLLEGLENKGLITNIGGKPALTREGKMATALCLGLALVGLMNGNGNGGHAPEGAS